MLEHIKQEQERVFVTKEAYNLYFKEQNYHSDFDDKKFYYFFPEDKLNS